MRVENVPKVSLLTGADDGLGGVEIGVETGVDLEIDSKGMKVWR